MIPRSLLPRASWLPLLLLYASLLPSITLAEEGKITLLENPAWSYRAELADFGYILDQRLRYNANLMTPPINESQLCSFPSFSLPNFDKASRLSKPVALLVSLGGCDTGQKVEVALEIHKKVTNFLRFVVFYNNDPNNPDEIFKVNPPPNNTIYMEDLEEMSFSAISTGTSSAILAHMQQFSSLSGATSDFLGPFSDGWTMEMIIETAANPYVGNRSRGTDGNFANSNFYWFRITLFALLVLSPFCRAMFLWWTGGGRIRLRRNETGRIVGFLYTPPMAYWFVSHGTQEPEPVADTMTTEEVMALPEIVYKPPPSEANLGTTTEVESDDSDDNDGAENKPITEQKDDGRLIQVVDREAATLNASQRTELVTTTTTGEDGVPMTTCSTACSICIDDFEEGEKIRLLRCGHAFHTDCILPWLTRRQGCCPMCKKNVMGGDEDEETNTGVESLPFSRCLEINSGVETVEGSGATPSVDRTVAAGDVEVTSINGGNDNNEESTTLPDDVIMIADPEQGAYQDIVNAVVSGFADSLKSELSHDTDFMEAEEENNNQIIPPADDVGAATERDVISGLPEMENDSEMKLDDHVESSNNSEGNMVMSNAAEVPKTENDAMTTSDIAENDLKSEVEKESSIPLDEQEDPSGDNLEQVKHNVDTYSDEDVRNPAETLGAGVNAHQSHTEIEEQDSVSQSTKQDPDKIVSGSIPMEEDRTVESDSDGALDQLETQEWKTGDELRDLV